MRVVRALSAAIGLALIWTATANAVEPDEFERCGTEDESFVCDMIHVNFMSGVDVEQIVRDHGGNPETDILQETAVSNGRIIAVERGGQIEAVSDYISDPLNVRYAELLPWRAEHGDGLPNTAMPQNAVGVLALGAAFLALAALSAGTSIRRKGRSRQ